MSKKDSRKELAGVYRRCLSALTIGYAIDRVPSKERLERFEKQATRGAAWKAASEKPFKDDKERAEWTKARFDQLVSDERARLAKDPNAAARERIKSKLSELR